MRLKRLDIIGFKSFADKTQVIFDQGVTCVVGPNGCGKSNISDSIRWVLGERSAKMLRGSKMEDVIFNGTDFRKPLSYAEVALTIDNEDRGLPIDYNEVTIARRLYRTGESEYLINKTVVRLKDVQDLILDTGIGSNSYSMIEQGRIDYILRADPEKRRFLIEEAAGISKYKVKKDEAIRKLERTEQNILRLNDIIQEVHKQIQYAERQARRAERYKENYEKLKVLEIKKSFLDLKSLRDNKNSLQGQQSKEQVELEELNQKKQEQKTSLDGFQSQLDETQRKYSEEEAKRYGLVSKKEKNEQQLEFHQEKRVEFATRKGEIAQEITTLQERVEKNKSEIEAKQTELQGFEGEKGKVQVSLDESEKALAKAEEELSKVKQALEKSKLEAFELSTEATRTRNEYHRMMAFIETSDKQKDKMNTNLERYSSEHKDWEVKKSQYENEIQDFSTRTADLETRENQLQQELLRLKQNLEDLSQEKISVEKAQHEKETRVKMLQDLDASAQISKEKILEEVPELQSNLIHSLRDVIKVQSGYEWALEAALQAFAESILVEDIESAKKMFDYLSNNRASGIGLFLHFEEEGQSHEASSPAIESQLVKCSLLDVVEVAESYQKVLHPFFKNLYVVEKINSEMLQEYLQLAKRVHLVSQEGVYLGAHGQVYFRQGKTDEQSFFQRGKEIEDLQGAIGQDAQRLEQLTQQIESTRKQLSETEINHKVAHDERLDLKIQKETTESFRDGLEERLTSYTKEKQLVMDDILELTSQQAEVKLRKENLEKDLQNLNEKEKASREYEARVLKDIEERDHIKNAVLKDVAACRAKRDHLADQERLVRESLQILLDSDKQAKERVQSLEEESVRIQDKEKELTTKDEQLNVEQEQLRGSIHQADVALEIMTQEKAKVQAEISQIETRLQEITERQDELQEILHQAEMKVMDIGYQEKTIHERMQQTYDVRLSELKEEDYPFSAEELAEQEPQLEKLRDKMKSMGAVNLLAIEEYDELKQRYDFMTGQKQDLENAREALLEAIRKINRTTKNLFEETFQNVQAAFKDYYTTLFRGGEARLVLVDETKPLESGIDVVVRPPGKRLTHISLLSGGEKAMTAIALLFALFKIKPSPFCVLDEVDAPLDEANIDRFLAVLKSFLQTSQFIIITHNRKTIGMGDSLYGVTMEEAGVSKIVSVKVNIDENDVETPDEGSSTAVEDSVTA